jgi:long-chain acyl-CoA synthetase
VTPCDVGEPGEIHVRGPNVMRGYWNRPRETEDALDDGGWYRTGDAAYVDEDGYVFVVDRVKDMIISGGENVYCVEVENAIHRHPAVMECAVFGIPHERWGEQVHAAVVLRPDARCDADDIVEHCRSLIAGYKLPRSIALHDELPKSGAGKVLKRDLRAPYWLGRERQVS